jgi:glutathione S-transferase
MAAAFAGIDLEPVTVETGPQPEELTSVNPLGQVPSMVLDNGNSVFDSRTITQCLNRMSKGALFPRTAGKRLEAELLEALADGICDCLLAHVYERRMRPPEKVHQPWLDLQWSKALRSLDRLNAQPPRLGKRAHAGHIALRACLGYLDLRFPGQWERGRHRLRRWAARFDQRYPGLKQYLPG